MPEDDNSLDRVQSELGDPEAAYGARNAAKFALALGLLAVSAAGHFAWWVFGPANFTGIVAKLLFVPPILAVALLWHLIRTRGLHVLLYPTGLLRFQRGEVESYPWVEVTAVHIKADQGNIEMTHGPDGRVSSAWLEVDPPFIQVWNTWLSLTRTDEESVKLTPVIADFSDLVERVQRATFALLWPGMLAALHGGRTVHFGPFEVRPGGLSAGKSMLLWSELSEIAVTGKCMNVKRKGRWLTWASHSLEQVPNPHLFLALVHEARRAAVPEPVTEGEEGEEED